MKRFAWVVFITFAVGFGFLNLRYLIFGPVASAERPPARSDLEVVCERINRTLPLQVNEVFLLDRIVPGAEGRVVYLVTLNLPKRDPSVLSNQIVAMKPALVEMYRNNPAMAEVRRRNLDLDTRFRDTNGTVLATLRVSPRDPVPGRRP